VAVAVEAAHELPQALAQLDVDAGGGPVLSMITGGLCTSACATSTLRFMPPDSVRMLALAFPVRSRWCITSSIQASLPRIPK
jgi:hypothetical protein